MFILSEIFTKAFPPEARQAEFALNERGQDETYDFYRDFLREAFNPESLDLGVIVKIFSKFFKIRFDETRGKEEY
jgi:hypothetical protein